MDEKQIQKQYYSDTASKYDEMHLFEDEHELGLAVLSGFLSYYDFSSLLDVGAGTGRVMRYLSEEGTKLDITGIEPVEDLRKIGRRAGIAAEKLIDGDALALPYADNEWDVVSAFGILHHIANPEIAIAEMCRVARYGVFFSDLNNFGCGSRGQRAFAQTLRFFKLWRGFQWLKNGGKSWKYSEGDGVFYSYSLFDSLKTIRKKFPQTHIINTAGKSSNFFKGCSHVAVFAVKDKKTLSSLNRRAKKFENNSE